MSRRDEIERQIETLQDQLYEIDTQDDDEEDTSTSFPGDGLVALDGPDYSGMHTPEDIKRVHDEHWYQRFPESEPKSEPSMDREQYQDALSKATTPEDIKRLHDLYWRGVHAERGA